MELKDLRAFVAVAEELHFGHAARRLNISPPPLTARIQKLEADLGVELFRRTKRSVALTVAGVALLDDARQLIERADGLGRKLGRAQQGETGLLRAGVIGASVFTHAERLRRSVVTSHPDIALEWRVLGSAEQVEAVVADRLDLGIVNTPIDLHGLASIVLQREPLVAALPSGHPLADEDSLSLKDLHRDVFIFSERRLAPSYYDRFIASCNSAGFAPIVQHQVSSILSYVGLVAMGAGVSLVPLSLVEAGLKGVRYVPLRSPRPSVEVSLAWDPQKRSPALARVVALAKSTVRAPRAPPTSRTLRLDRPAEP